MLHGDDATIAIIANNSATCRLVIWLRTTSALACDIHTEMPGKPALRHDSYVWQQSTRDKHRPTPVQ